MKTFDTSSLAAAMVLPIAALLPLECTAAPGRGQIGNIAWSISAAPNALDAGAFAMTANDTRYRLMGTYPSMSTMVQGSCGETLAVSVLLQNDPRLKLEQFRASRASRDLPVHELIQVSGRVLAEHCGALQVLRVAIQNFGYEGTATRTGNWALQDGHLPTESDARARVDLRIEDPKGYLHVRHRGTCEAEPKMLIEPIRGTVPDRSDTLFYDYAALAGRAAAQYARQCRMLQRAQFALAEMPSRWLCAQPGDCFMEARLKDGQWLGDTRQLVPRAADNPVANVFDMIEVLAAGRFDILRDDDAYFGYIAAGYFEAYSELCRQHIRQPVAKVTRYTTIKEDGFGNRTLETSETTPVYVEAEHGWIYDTSQLKGGFYLTQNLLRMKTLADGMALVGEKQQLRKLLDGKCTDELTLAVHQNIVNHASGKSPFVGKFTTAKKPIVHVAQDGQSAPEFIRAYVLERQQRDAVSAQRAANDPAAPPAPPTAPPAPAATGASTSDLQRQHIDAVARLEQDYRAQMQGAGALQRLRLEAELKVKRLMLEREFRDNLKRAQQP